MSTTRLSLSTSFFGVMSHKPTRTWACHSRDLRENVEVTKSLKINNSSMTIRFGGMNNRMCPFSRITNINVTKSKVQCLKSRETRFHTHAGLFSVSDVDKERRVFISNTTLNKIYWLISAAFFLIVTLTWSHTWQCCVVSEILYFSQHGWHHLKVVILLNERMWDVTFFYLARQRGKSWLKRWPNHTLYLWQWAMD